MEKIKLVVVGNGNVGKSCLIRTFCENTFPRYWPMCIMENYSKDVMVDGKQYHIDLWDTAGIDDYDRLRPLSYKNTDVFLICFSINNRDSFKNIAKKWIPEINHHCPNVPFLIIRNKHDLKHECELNIHKNNLLAHGYLRMQRLRIPSDIWKYIEKYADAVYDNVSDEEGEKLCKEVGGYKYMSCSSLRCEGLGEIFDQVVYCHINAQLPEEVTKCSNCLLL